MVLTLVPREKFKLLSIQFDQSLVLERGIIFVVVDFLELVFL